MHVELIHQILVIFITNNYSFFRPVPNSPCERWWEVFASFRYSPPITIFGAFDTESLDVLYLQT